MDSSRVEYKVIPEHRIVVAEIRGTSYDALDMFNDKFLACASSAPYLWLNKQDEKFLMPWRMKAVAHCHPDDVFDEKKGKEIALKKLSEKYNRSLNKHLFNILHCLDVTLKRMDKYFEGREF